MDRDAKAFGTLRYAFRVRQGIPAKLKRIPNWQARLRNYVELLVMKEGAQQTMKDGES
ncbi:MAG: hypothetical protein WCD18_16430 [Thermosynechococcaceae cyanobacterium]